MAKLDPFGFFAHHASAFIGCGGQESSPDPRYCFHTPYQHVDPGHGVFNLTLADLSGPACEINVRVMAYRPGGEAVMATSTRIDFAGEASIIVEKSLRFLAVEGVQYALYGYLSEPAQLRIAQIEIALLSEADLESQLLNQLAFVSTFSDKTRLVRANRLTTDREPTLAHPFSQPLTIPQLYELAEGGLWPDVMQALESPVEQWKVVYPLQVLSGLGLLDGAAKGMLHAPPHPVLATNLEQAGCLVSQTIQESKSLLSEDEIADDDFVIGFLPPSSSDNGFDLIDKLLEVLADGGIGIAVLDLSPMVDVAEFCNRLQRLMLRLIGGQHDVEQLAFSRPQDWLVAKGEPGAFGLVFRKWAVDAIPA